MEKISQLSDIAGRLSPNRRIILHSALAEPLVLGDQLAHIAPRLSGCSVYNLMPMGPTPYGAADVTTQLDVHTFLPGAGLRAAVNESRATQHAVRLYDIAGFVTDTAQQPDVLFLQLSPPDSNGEMSLGLSVDYMPAVLARKPLVVAEINPQMPVTLGDTSIYAADVDYAIDVDYPPQAMPAGKADAIDERVAENVVGLVSDNSVIQYGIGTIPELVPVRAGHLHGLSIHTGLITDAIMPALASAAFDNSGQPDHAGKVVTTMAGGSQAFYRFLHQNDQVIFRPTLYTHGRETLRRIKKLIAINSVLQVDLRGNANAERIGSKIISGPGGLFDFARGASESSGGISVLAIRSCSRRGDQSSIVPQLAADITPTVTVEHLDYVVTEHGVASVRGKSGTALANALVAVADPQFRGELKSHSV